MRLFVIIIIVSLSACTKKDASKNILKPEKMQAVLWDYLRADVYANEILRQDTTLNLDMESARLQQKVFLQHKITKEQFYKSYDYYMEHRDQFKPILDTIIVRQQRLTSFPSTSPAGNGAEKGTLNRKKVLDQVLDTLKTAE